MPNNYKKVWSLVFKGVVWAEFKLLAGVGLIISLGPGSSAGKVGAYAPSSEDAGFGPDITSQVQVSW